MTHQRIARTFVLLPDPLRFSWTLPKDNCDFSTHGQLLKSYFSSHCHPKYCKDLDKDLERNLEALANFFSFVAA